MRAPHLFHGLIEGESGDLPERMLGDGKQEGRTLETLRLERGRNQYICVDNQPKGQH